MSCDAAWIPTIRRNMLSPVHTTSQPKITSHKIHYFFDNIKITDLAKIGVIIAL